MAGQTGWGFFGSKSNNTSENKVDKNAKKIQDFINKYKIRSRDLNVPSEVVKDQGSYTPGWQSFAWLEEATVTSNNRTTRYKEYREMIRIPELNQSINIYADNGTQFNVQKNVMEIGSDNNKIVEIVDKLMFENLDMNSNLWSIVRNTCKLGDEFLEVIVDNVDNPKHIISLERIKKPENMKRVEREGNLIEFRYEYEDEEKENRIFQPWQIVHFRIEDEEFEPYGRSILESGRKTFKKLSLMEDAMLIYRISRAPERRVFYVDVGTMPTKEANKFMETLKRQFRKKKFINPTTGEVDEKANPLCITLNTKIPLLDGRTLTLTELIEEYKDGKENWAYSIDVENDNQVVPGRITWADVTRKDAKLIKVILDNGEELRTTPDHKFMLRDGSYCEAQDLKGGQALMPFYTKLSSKEDKDKIDGYEKIYNPKTGKYEYTHRIVGNIYDDWKNRKFTSFNNNKTIHHKDFNKLNNIPDNLRVMSFGNHRKLHQDMSYIYNDIRSKNMKKQFSDPELRQKYIDGMTIRNKVTNKFWSLLKDAAQVTQPNSQGYISITNVIENACNNNKLMQEWKTFCKPNKQINGPNRHFIVKAMREIGYESSEQWLKEICGVNTKSLRTPNTKFATQKFQEKMKKKEEKTLVIINQYFTKNTTIYSKEITNFCKENGFLYTYIKNVLIRNNYNVLSSITQRLDNIETICLDKASEYNKMQDFILQEEISRKQYYNILNRLNLKSWKELRLLSKQSTYQNHKVAKIEWLDYKEDTGDITIDKYHNFATKAGVFVHNSVDEDFYIPVRQNSQGTRIETLPGGCLTLDTKIDMLDGKSYTLEEMITNYNNGKEQWIYSCDPDTGEIVPGIVSWAGITHKNAKILEIELNNGEIIRCTPDHKFPVWGSGKTEAKDLKVNDSIIAHNKKISSKDNKDKIDGYEKVYNHLTKKYEYTHRIVANNLKNTDKYNEYIYKYTNDKLSTIHHQDYNKKNNNPDNLIWMGSKDHYKYHSENMEVLRIGYLNWWNNLFEVKKQEFIDKTKYGRDKGRKIYHNKLKNDRKFRKIVTDKQSISAKKYIKSLSKEEKLKRDNNSKNNFIKANVIFNNKMNNNLDFRRAVLSKRNKSVSSAFTDKRKKAMSLMSKKMWKEKNHYEKVFGNSYIKLDEVVLTKFTDIFYNNKNYTKTLDWINNNPNNDFTKYLAEINKNNISNFNPYKLNRRFSERFFKYFNFSGAKDFTEKITNRNHRVVAIRSISKLEDVGTLTIDKYEKYHNYHTFALSSGVYTYNSNLGEIDDVKYFKDQILRTMGIPTGYLGGNSSDAGAGTYDPKSYLSNQEVQFSRTIERIQKLIIKGLEKIALIELVFSKIESKEIRDFKIKLTPPSNVDQLMEIEIRNQQFALIQQVRALENFLPDEWIYKEILGMSEQEIQKIRLQIQMQMQMQLQMQNLGASAGGGMDMASGGNLGGNIMGGGAPGGAAGGPPESGMGGQEAPPEGGSEVPAGGEKAGLEVAGTNFIEFDGGKWLFENNKDIEKLLKYVNLYEKVHKDNNSNKIKYEQKNSATRMIIEGEFRGLLKAYRSSNKIQRTLNEKVKMSK